MFFLSFVFSFFYILKILVIAIFMNILVTTHSIDLNSKHDLNSDSEIKYHIFFNIKYHCLIYNYLHGLCVLFIR